VGFEPTPLSRLHLKGNALTSQPSQRYVRITCRVCISSKRTSPRWLREGRGRGGVVYKSHIPGQDADRCICSTCNHVCTNTLQATACLRACEP
jgi:hypothetical protein